MSDHPSQDRFSKAEIGKDAVQSTVEAAADAVGQVARIVTKAVQEVAGAVGGFATEMYEIREAAKKASEEHLVASELPREPGPGPGLPEPSDPAPAAGDVDPSESS